MPNNCVLCHATCKHNLALCAGCCSDLPRIENACSQCGRLLQLSQPKCGNCLAYPPAYDKTLAPFKYQTHIQQLILQLKFGERLINAAILGQLLGNHLLQHYQNQPVPQLLIPIPLHRNRLQKRGYNQAIEIARPIAKLLQLPIDITTCTRDKNTLPQASIPLKNRHANIKNAFRITKPPSCQHLAIIDDVITTGNTVNELSKVLKKAGVKRIDIWCCARP